MQKIVVLILTLMMHVSSGIFAQEVTKQKIILFAAIEGGYVDMAKNTLSNNPVLINARNEKNETVQGLIAQKLAEAEKDLNLIGWDLPNCNTTIKLRTKVEKYKELEVYIKEVKSKTEIK